MLSFSKEDLDFDNDEINKSYSQFVINRLVGSIDVLMPHAFLMNMTKIPNCSHYDYMRGAIPKGYYKWDWSQINTVRPAEEKIIIKTVAKYFELGDKDAIYYIDVMGTESVNKIINLYAETGRTGQK